VDDEVWPGELRWQASGVGGLFTKECGAGDRDDGAVMFEVLGSA
jgi:hypothetical protein